MKTVLRTMALGLFVCGSCFMAGCGDEAATDTPAETTETPADSTDEATETSSVTPKTTTTVAGATQLVSLKVPNMT